MFPGPPKPKKRKSTKPEGVPEGNKINKQRALQRGDDPDADQQPGILGALSSPVSQSTKQPPFQSDGYSGSWSLGYSGNKINKQRHLQSEDDSDSQPDPILGALSSPVSQSTGPETRDAEKQPSRKSDGAIAIAKQDWENCNSIKDFYAMAAAGEGSFRVAGGEGEKEWEKAKEAFKNLPSRSHLKPSKLKLRYVVNQGFYTRDRGIKHKGWFLTVPWPFKELVTDKKTMKLHFQTLAATLKARALLVKPDTHKDLFTDRMERRIRKVMEFQKAHVSGLDNSKPGDELKLEDEPERDPKIHARDQQDDEVKIEDEEGREAKMSARDQQEEDAPRPRRQGRLAGEAKRKRSIQDFSEEDDTERLRKSPAHAWMGPLPPIPPPPGVQFPPPPAKRKSKKPKKMAKEIKIQARDHQGDEVKVKRLRKSPAHAWMGAEAIPPPAGWTGRKRQIPPPQILYPEAYDAARLPPPPPPPPPPVSKKPKRAAPPPPPAAIQPLRTPPLQSEDDSGSGILGALSSLVSQSRSPETRDAEKQPSRKSDGATAIAKVKIEDEEELESEIYARDQQDSDVEVKIEDEPKREPKTHARDQQEVEVKIEDEPEREPKIHARDQQEEDLAQGKPQQVATLITAGQAELDMLRKRREVSRARRRREHRKRPRPSQQVVTVSTKSTKQKMLDVLRRRREVDDRNARRASGGDPALLPVASSPSSSSSSLSSSSRRRSRRRTSLFSQEECLRMARERLPPPRPSSQEDVVRMFPGPPKPKKRKSTKPEGVPKVAEGNEINKQRALQRGDDSDSQPDPILGALSSPVSQSRSPETRDADQQPSRKSDGAVPSKILVSQEECLRTARERLPPPAKRKSKERQAMALSSSPRRRTGRKKPRAFSKEEFLRTSSAKLPAPAKRKSKGRQAMAARQLNVGGLAGYRAGNNGPTRHHIANLSDSDDSLVGLSKARPTRHHIANLSDSDDPSKVLASLSDPGAWGSNGPWAGGTF